jgi:hypothetical protein
MLQRFAGSWEEFLPNMQVFNRPGVAGAVIFSCLQCIEIFVVLLLFIAMQHHALWLRTVRFVHCLLSAPCSGLAPGVASSAIRLHPSL